ncbi:uncharacterized protein MONBRDRAFT_33910 [Monosiga brevicollis MX1]|uniref:Tetraspanin n=1 Tax=Monosiga brevicollis TaxID=81824 RepID=A9V8D7_MONBE|nr:uncharacterized protein MONBRDRAFT_33910 [Monosiga brevicollis MX1]EDQ86250.1 predicted protein [Monosiga brevicollis MX1]|eukprot:XP_001748920.1 hypothetical protein [Monosiga brevicollis MX1]
MMPFSNSTDRACLFKCQTTPEPIKNHQERVIRCHFAIYAFLFLSLSFSLSLSLSFFLSGLKLSHFFSQVCWVARFDVANCTMTSETKDKSGFSVALLWLYVFNGIYLVLGLTLIGVAAAAQAEAVLTDLTILGGVIAMGVFLVMVSIFGIVGTARRSPFLLFLYILFMVLLFVMQFSIGVAALSVSQTQQKQLLSEGWCKLSDERQIWFQNSTNCYGFENASKYEPNDCMAPPPQNASNPKCPTRCAAPECGVEPTDTLPRCETCYDAVKGHLLMSNMASGLTDRLLRRGGGICLAFAFLELLGVVAAIRYRRDARAPATYNAFM